MTLLPMLISPLALIVKVPELVICAFVNVVQQGPEYVPAVSELPLMILILPLEVVTLTPFDPVRLVSFIDKLVPDP